MARRGYRVIQMKKKLTQSEEFEILKLVLDKFLWLGFGIMGYGSYALISGKVELVKGLSYLFGGAVLLMLLMFILIKEYEVVK